MKLNFIFHTDKKIICNVALIILIIFIIFALK
jgi:hypothetical protein